MNALYADGGVIHKNPSTVGGTWAYRLLRDGMVVFGEKGIITPEQADMPAITNNLTEMLAVLFGLKRLPDDWRGTIYSDSQVTLGRLFEGWKWSHIPPWMHALYQAQRARLVHWNEFKHVLLDGHPTRSQLEAGLGKRGHPVSEHNVWCDKACQEIGLKFLETQAVRS